jgi:hypothetical protein
MAIAKIEAPPESNMGAKIVPWEKRHAAGKDLRRAVPRESHAEWTVWKGRPDPMELLADSNKGREKSLIPLRMGCMAASPFTFLRGSAWLRGILNTFCVWCCQCTEIPDCCT